MSRLQKLRKKVEYETDTPRCSNCTNYRKAAYYLRDSLPVPTHAMCVLHAFTVRPNACCNKWSGADGSLLDVEPKTKPSTDWSKVAGESRSMLDENGHVKLQPAGMEWIDNSNAPE
jgi:hypothetical protein